MNLLSFIPKSDNALPDHYGLKIFYLDGKSEDFEVAEHMMVKENHYLSFASKDDVWSVIPLSAIKRIEFDKRWSKIVELRRKAAKK